LEGRGELEQPERVARRGRVEHDDVIIHVLHLFHDLCERNGFINARDGRREVLEEGAVAPEGGTEGAGGSAEALKAALGAELSVWGARVDLHREEVGVPVDGEGLTTELLAEGIAEVMRRVRGDDEDLSPVRGVAG